jgi:hypothetical protein
MTKMPVSWAIGPCTENVDNPQEGGSKLLRIFYAYKPIYTASSQKTGLFVSKFLYTRYVKI